MTYTLMEGGLILFLFVSSLFDYACAHEGGRLALMNEGQEQSISTWSYSMNEKQESDEKKYRYSMNENGKNPS